MRGQTYNNMICSIVLAAALLPRFSRAFSFNTSVPTQCGQWTVDWDGGSPPFYLILIPTETVDSGRIVNVSIPSDVSKPYSHTFQLNEPAGLKFVATMYDSKGFGTGGTTDVLTVGSGDDSSCLDSNLLYDFFFSTDPQSNPSQCSSMHISWNDNVTYPLNLYGIIPFGTAFNIPVPQEKGQAAIDWTVNIKSSTEFLLFMSDAGRYQTGGSTSLLTVGGSGDGGCLNATSPHRSSATSAGGGDGSGSGGSPSSIAGVGGGSSGGDSNGGGSSGGDNSSSHTGAIVGGTLGGVAFLVLIGVLLWFCIRRSSRGKDGSVFKSYGIHKEKPAGSSNSREPMDLLVGGGAAHRHNSDGSNTIAGLNDSRAYTPMPFRYPSPDETHPAGGPNTGFNRQGGAGQMQNIGGASAALAAAGMNEKQRPFGSSNPSSPISPILPTHYDNSQLPRPAYAESNRRSSDDRSGETGTTGLTPSTDPTHPSSGPTSFKPPHGSGGQAYPAGLAAQLAGAPSDSATVGHVGRSDSTRKEGRRASVSTIPGGGGQGGGGGGGGGGNVTDSEGQGTPASGPRPLPEPPIQYVQHVDSGRIVDVPPAYNQLRAQNPDGE